MSGKKVLITWTSDPLKEPIIRGWISFFNRNGIEYSTCILNHSVLKPASVSSTLKFIRVLFTGTYSYVLANDVYSAFWALLVTRVRRKKVIYNVQELYSEFVPWNRISSFRRKTILVREFFLYKWADFLIFPNERRKELIKARYKVTEERTRVFENIPTYFNQITSEKFKKKYLVYSGTVTENRPIEVLGPLSVFLKKYDIAVLIIAKKNKQVENLLANYSNVEYLDYIEPDRLLSCLSECFLGIAIYNDRDLNNRFCAPVKFYDYILAKLPFLIVDNPSILDLAPKYPPIMETFHLNSYESLQEKVEKMINGYEEYKSNISLIPASETMFSRYDKDLKELHDKLTELV